MSLESDPIANKVNQAAWLLTIHYDFVEEFQTPQILDVLRRSPFVSLWIVAGGFPCQPHPALNPRRRHFRDERSQHNEIRRIADQLQSLVPEAIIHVLAENVIMPTWAMDRISSDLRLSPIKICPSGRSPARRPRLIWLSWPVRARQGTRLLRHPIKE